MQANKIFNRYAKYYDIIYTDKDYGKECDFIEEIFRNLKFMPKTILDGGCGTGGHAILLAKRGYEVTGIDLSEEMINIAKEKASKSRVNVNFNRMDLRELRLNKKFDACICMFATIDYLTNNEDLLKALSNIRGHLKEGSLFIFDFWYGPAVLTIKPSSRVKIIEKEGVKVIRTVVPELDTFNSIVKSNYYLVAVKDGKIIDEVREVHVLRYFFPQELTHYLDEAGFKVLKFCQFPYLDKPPSENTWNVAAIAAAK